MREIFPLTEQEKKKKKTKEQKKCESTETFDMNAVNKSLSSIREDQLLPTTTKRMRVQVEILQKHGSGLVLPCRKKKQRTKSIHTNFYSTPYCTTT